MRKATKYNFYFYEAGKTVSEMEKRSVMGCMDETEAVGAARCVANTNQKTVLFFAEGAKKGKVQKPTKSPIEFEMFFGPRDAQNELLRRIAETD